MHCIEVFLARGKTFSEFRVSGFGNRESDTPFDIEYIMIERPREELYQRINLRVHKMIEAGLVQEAKAAFEKLGVDLSASADSNPSLPNSINTVGYKELFAYFDGTMDFITARERLKKNTRVYAKKQLTWYAKDPDIITLHPADAVEEILKRL